MSKTENKIVRVAAAYHNKLIAEKDILISDLAAMADNLVQSEQVIVKIKELAKLESEIETIRKHFGDDAQKSGNEENTKSEKTSGS